MDYEKKYKEALANARQEYTTTENVERKQWLEELFPELAESEDERIKGAIIEYLKDNNLIEWAAWLEKQGKDRPTTIDVDKMVLKYSQTRETCTNGLPVNCQIRAYRQGINDTLEKQGEQNSVNDTDKEIVNAIKDTSVLDMIEPKFKIGDWVFDERWNKVEQISVINKVGYRFSNGSMVSFACANVHFHLWTINDAKDGDVLASDNSIFIFQEEYIAEKPIAYCGLMNGLFIKGEDACWTNEKCHPATKEQCELLFKKMNEAGYGWDAEKKELKIVNWSKHIKYDTNSPSIIESKQAWSDEDDAYKKFAISAVEVCYDEENPIQKELVDWLKSLKDRVQPKPKECNDEDEKIRNILIRICINALPDIFKRYGYEGDKKNIIAWLEKQAM